jgi:hypothetical protein
MYPAVYPVIHNDDTRNGSNFSQNTMIDDKPVVHPSIQVITFNRGMTIKDYSLLCEANNIQFANSSSRFAMFKNAEKSTLQFLLKQNASVFLLQEVGCTCIYQTKSHPEQYFNPAIISELINHKYTIIRSEKKMFGDPNKSYYGAWAYSSDTAIALDNAIFGNIENHSCRISLTGIASGQDSISAFKKDVAIATAVHRESGKKFCFVSAHVPGFDYTNLTPGEVANTGDNYCEQIAEKVQNLFQLHNCHIVMGADMNANLKLHFEGAKRFKLFLERGLTISGSGQPTNITLCEDPQYQAREIDYFILSQGLNSEIQKHNRGFYPSYHSSDHMYVISKITFPPK